VRFRAFGLAALAVIPAAVLAAQPTFRDKYNGAAKDMVPVLQTTSCETKQAKAPAGKAITECRLQMANSLLSLDSMNNRLSGVWLMLDSTRLDDQTDLVRSGGMLLRAARGTSYGDYLAVSADVFDASRRRGWKEACADDKASSSRFCVSANERGIFHITLSPIQ
jgi:hypothetical protein